MDDHPESIDRGNHGESLMRRFKLGTLILLIVIFALGLALFVQQRREARLKSALTLYRDRGHEKILEHLIEPIVLVYTDQAPLEDVLKQIKDRTKGARLPNGIPIYVDPIGLTEADLTLISPVKTPATKEELSLGEQLQRILKPLGLASKAEAGFLMITSEESLDESKGEEDPYLKYRDVLK
jgi:hypothetical protein